MFEFDIKRYNEELEKLFVKFPSFQSAGGSTYKPGLDAMRLFDKELGEVSGKYPTIHVAGTNGKGSTSHLLASALMSLGFKVGLYTSPHLVDFRERIKINGEMISREEVYEFTLKRKDYFDLHQLSFFEITTGMAFDHFARSGVDIAVIETGLGGRLDSTNIITPLLSVITNVGIDHTEFLGDTIREIAFEKAGIIKKNVPVVLGERSEEYDDIFREISANCDNVPLYFGETSDIIYASYIPDLLGKMDLRGEYQIKNLKTALKALELLRESYIGSRWNWQLICEGLENASVRTGLRGRWESVYEKPLIICDTAHNPHGFREVMRQLREVDARRKYMLLGFVSDKDIDTMIKMLPRDAFYLITNPQSKRALPVKQLYKLIRKAGLNGESFDSVKEAFERFRTLSSEGDMLYVGGSNYIVAEFLYSVS